MPRVHNWEEWDEVEEQIQEEQVRKKIDVKNKSKQRKDKKTNEKSFKIQGHNKSNT